MKRYWKYIRPYIQYYILGPCFMMMEVVGDVLLPYMLAKIINQGIAERNVVYRSNNGSWRCFRRMVCF